MKSQPLSTYFKRVHNWADDKYSRAMVTTKHYQWAFFAAMTLSCLLTIALVCLIPLQHLQPLLVNHYQDGRVLVQPLQSEYLVHNQALVESELVRYVINRESYDATSYHEQYALINLLSSASVAKQYRRIQSIHNQHALVNQLNTKGHRSVHIDSVIFLDKAHAKTKNKQRRYNLAQVNFSLTDYMQHDSSPVSHAFAALISWQYVGTPLSPSERWRDWDGFVVTRYSVEQRNVKSTTRSIV
ncbi:MAG: type IV secretion system protein [Coxiellaceae bacterium]|nr:type IV secretion system protein [Coxiellaceae bacterium]